jgi:hypothetical protein
MRRDDIKIIEFGMDADPGTKPGSAEPGAIKVIEFDNDREDNRPRVVTGKDVGHIKIVEFDDDSPSTWSKAPERPKVTMGPVKVVEFDKERGESEFDTGPRGIKILEFD